MKFGVVRTNLSEIKDGIQKIARLPEVNELFKALNCETALLTAPNGRTSKLSVFILLSTTKLVLRL